MTYSSEVVPAELAEEGHKEASGTRFKKVGTG